MVTRRWEGNRHFPVCKPFVIIWQKVKYLYLVNFRIFRLSESGWSDSNRRHSAWKADVLPLNCTRKCGNKHYNLKTNKSFIGWILITSQAHPSHGWNYNITIILDCQASDKIWTCDLSFTKALLYHWATEAYSPGRIWTYDQSINSRWLCRWATEEYMET